MIPLRSKILSPADLAKIRRMAEKEDLNGKRALALLALNGGASLNEAAGQTGLSRGQVRYILDRFRKIGINALLTTAALEQDASAKSKLNVGENEKSGLSKIKKKERSKKKGKKTAKPKKSKKQKLKDKEKKKEAKMEKARIKKKNKKKEKRKKERKRKSEKK